MIFKSRLFVILWYALLNHIILSICQKSISWLSVNRMQSHYCMLSCAKVSLVSVVISSIVVQDRKVWSGRLNNDEHNFFIVNLASYHIFIVKMKCGLYCSISWRYWGATKMNWTKRAARLDLKYTGKNKGPYPRTIKMRDCAKINAIPESWLNSHAGLNTAKHR